MASFLEREISSLAVEISRDRSPRSRDRKWAEATNVVDSSLVNNPLWMADSGGPGNSSDTRAKSPQCAAPLCPLQQLCVVPNHNPSIFTARALTEAGAHLRFVSSGNKDYGPVSSSKRGTANVAGFVQIVLSQRIWTRRKNKSINIGKESVRASVQYSQNKRRGTSEGKERLKCIFKRVKAFITKTTAAHLEDYYKEWGILNYIVRRCYPYKQQYP